MFRVKLFELLESVETEREWKNGLESRVMDTKGSVVVVGGGGDGCLLSVEDADDELKLLIEESQESSHSL